MLPVLVGIIYGIFSKSEGEITDIVNYKRKYDVTIQWVLPREELGDAAKHKSQSTERLHYDYDL